MNRFMQVSFHSEASEASEASQSSESRDAECGHQAGHKAGNGRSDRGAQRHKDRVYTRDHDTVQPWHKVRYVNLLLFGVIVAFAPVRVKVEILIFRLAGILIFVHLVLI